MKNILKKYRFVAVVIVAMALGLGYLGFRYVTIARDLKTAAANFAVKEAELLDNIKKLEEDSDQVVDLLQSEQERNQELTKEVESLQRKLGVFNKLSEIDEELLQKYSRVYFLNENYTPRQLLEIDKKYLYEKNRPALIHEKVQKYLYRLVEDAAKQETGLLIVSAYRSFGQQGALKTGYATVYGSGANKFSADQGYSEHQLGTAVDFTSPKLAASFTKFAADPSFQWLLKNAHKYGFILSYPKENTYYQFEPWHWRFVGIALASDLHDRNQHFYDMPQREIDTYLINLFD